MILKSQSKIPGIQKTCLAEDKLSSIIKIFLEKGETSQKLWIGKLSELSTI